MDIDLIKSLLLEADATNAPSSIGRGEFENREFIMSSGWKVVIFYDSGDLDYIDHFVSPDGRRIEVWGEEADPRLNDSGDDRCFTSLQNWRDVGDGHRLSALL